jgi:hypothetical protein
MNERMMCSGLGGGDQKDQHNENVGAAASPILVSLSSLSLSLPHDMSHSCFERYHTKQVEFAAEFLKFAEYCAWQQK